MFAPLAAVASVVLLVIFGASFFKPDQPRRIIEEKSDVLGTMKNRLEYGVTKLKGSGCYIPDLEPYAWDVMHFSRTNPNVSCQGVDWVKCNVSTCSVVPEILKTRESVRCEVQDVLYDNDRQYHISKNKLFLYANQAYTLIQSDHIKIKCVGTNINTHDPEKWSGVATGLRESVTSKEPGRGREDTLNVLMFVFDSASRLAFIRKMPKSYKFLKNELEATFFTSYVLGDATTVQLFALLTGKNELEHPDKRNKWLSHTDFIFHKLRMDWYRTAFFEDLNRKTFQTNSNGFSNSPADHYMKALHLVVDKMNNSKQHCIGATPRYKLMMDITEQFFKLEGKKFCFTFVADISHKDFNGLAAVDDDFVEFLTNFRQGGHLENTLLFVMGDHGPRFPDTLRQTYQGKLEERLPLMSVVLPTRLVRERPDAAAALTANAQVLTTPHDIYATILDAVKLPKYLDKYVVRGANLRRGLSLLKPIPHNRSCPEAGVLPYWCACFRWSEVKEKDSKYVQVATALLEYINKLTEPFRDKCEKFNLWSVQYVHEGSAPRPVINFRYSTRVYSPVFITDLPKGFHEGTIGYRLQITVSPGKTIYNAMVTYLKKPVDKFVINSRDISVLKTYKKPICILNISPHLYEFCYCKGNEMT